LTANLEIWAATQVATLLPFLGGIETPTQHQMAGVTNSIYRFFIIQFKFYLKNIWELLIYGTRQGM